jgi:hypothetical protein
LPNQPGTSWNVELALFDDSLFVRGGPHGKSAYVYSESGEKLRGPVALRGFATSLGADGTLYTTECTATDLRAGELTLVAYDADLSERWSLNLGRGCTYGGTAIAPDGVLYLGREDPEGKIEVLAVQTQSPGLAPTPLPTRAADNRRTGWIAR